MKRSTLAKETVAISDAGRYEVAGQTVDIAEAVRECITRTRYFQPEELARIRDDVAARPNPEFEMRFEVVNETTLSGAAELAKVTEGRPVGVLNFASARNPGGGFLKGAQAQEESLARSSALYRSQLDCPGFYEHHRNDRSLLYSHRIIHSPGCPVFRDDAGDLLAEPYLVDFFTCPAPNAGAVRRNQPGRAGDITTVLHERMILLLALAAHLEVTDLVLGAWGCGVFQNDPTSVAEGFRNALCRKDLFAGRFRRVRFSVLGRPGGATVGVFEEAFGG